MKVGGVGVIVDAKPESVGFYERLGFERTDVLQGQAASRPAPLAMFLWIGTIKTAQQAAEEVSLLATEAQRHRAATCYSPGKDARCLCVSSENQESTQREASPEA